ncbi:MAG: nucleotide exchange factor GrpE [Chlorobi bacterium]|nr:nucleotide exchange factor GrpE [Chlorobiota bacterium]
MKKDKKQPEKEQQQMEHQEEKQDKPQHTAEELMEQKQQLEEELQAEKDRYIRLYAEFDNYKKRTQREKMDLIETASEDVVKALLPILDDFERALTELKKSGNAEVLKGVELIYEKLRKTLMDKGLAEIEVKHGDEFNPDIHEAVAQIPGDKKQSGKIHEVIEKGYKMGKKIIRYPKVITIQ